MHAFLYIHLVQHFFDQVDVSFHQDLNVLVNYYDEVYHHDNLCSFGLCNQKKKRDKESNEVMTLDLTISNILLMVGTKKTKE